MTYTVKILFTEFVTHDVKRFIVEKPEGFSFIPGQAIDVAINLDGWKEEKRPFTFTSLNEDLVLEFTIKRYADRKGVTDKLHSLQSGDELLLEDPWGTIQYKGPGIFIAGGAGITPFIAILRRLYKDNELAGNMLIFSNKTEKDIILQAELQYMFRDNPEKLILPLTREKKQGYPNSRVDQKFLNSIITDYSPHFYVCGPKPMVADLKSILEKLGADTESVVFEE